MTDEELAALKKLSDQGMSGDFFPGGAYCVIAELIDDLISARAELATLKSPSKMVR